MRHVRFPPSRGEEGNRENARTAPTPAPRRRTAAAFTPPPFSSLLPPSGGRSGGGSRPRMRRRPAGLARSANQDAGLRPAMPAHPGSSRMSGVGKVPLQDAEPLGQPPSRPPPFQGGGGQPGERANGPDAGPQEANRRRLHSSPLLFSPPPFRGEVGRGGRPRVRRRPAGLARSANEDAGLRPAKPAHTGNSRISRIEKVPIRAAEPGQPPSRPPPFQGGGEKTRGEERRRRGPPPCSAIESAPTGDPDSSPFQGGGVRTGERALLFSLLPPFRGEVGRGVPPLGSPASRRHCAKRGRGCGPSTRQASGAPAHTGNSPMSGIGKVPVRAAALDGPTRRTAARPWAG